MSHSRRVIVFATIGQPARRPGEALPHQHPTVLVTIADSLAAGNCAPGTEDWVNRYIPGRGSAAVDRTRMVEAACLAAVRRHRRAAQPGA